MKIETLKKRLEIRDWRKEILEFKHKTEENEILKSCVLFLKSFIYIFFKKSYISLTPKPVLYFSV